MEVMRLQMAGDDEEFEDHLKMDLGARVRDVRDRGKQRDEDADKTKIRGE